MKKRETLIKKFLESSGWGSAVRDKLSSDASFRNYERLEMDGKTAMLMNAPPAKEDIEPFINIDNYLRRRGFSSPEIYASDEVNGFILLEDLGVDSFTNVLSGKSKLSAQYNEYDLYSAAIDVLIQLDRSTLPSKMPDYDRDLLMKECKLFTEWYLPRVNPDMNTQAMKDDFVAIWEELFNFKKVGDDVLVLRDYHADNLMWLPERPGVETVGLLDFQDAVIGSPLYDIVSLLEDARRDVSPGTVNACINRYLAARKSIDKKDFMVVYAILAAQRNCKIVGIFARLAIRDKKPRYLDYLPRVWKHLENGLRHPELAKLKNWFDKAAPADLRTPEAFRIRVVKSGERAVG